jgi:hypothetical protein
MAENPMQILGISFRLQEFISLLLCQLDLSTKKPKTYNARVN